MEATRDSRFDPNYAAQLLLDVAHEQSVEALLRKLVARAADRPGVACVHIWLLGPGDRCATCAQRSRCPDQARCLHLAAGGGKGAPGARHSAHPEFNDAAARMPLGVGVVGSIAATGNQVVLRGAAPDWPALTDPAPPGLPILAGIRGFNGSPITFKGEVLGVTAAYVWDDMPEEAVPWGLIFANHIGSAIANARAFEEIQRLKAQLELHNAYLQEEVVEARAFGDLIGQSAALRQIASQIDLVAPTEASVLILGETGTGKELVAREIHRRSLRREGPLVRVNCASIPKDLFESEFFGHVQGAFTGALKDRAGRFETAHGGTLFLDEIGEVPPEMQGKLLRVLQERRYERVGDDRTRRADVRIIAATNRDLKAAVSAGRFREDLYYRLHVFPIHVPPLRERPDDIPLLAHHFVNVSVRDLKCARPRLTRAAMTRLAGYDWPGNIRELRNVIERAVILARGGTLAFDLPASAPSFPAVAPAGRVEPQAPGAPRAGFLTESELQRLERENLIRVLEHARWKIKGPDGAAELLGVKPTTLLSRMQTWGIRKPPGPENP